MTSNGMIISSQANTKIKRLLKSKMYSLVEKIGEGGFGCVYKAINKNTGQHVAIKIISGDSQLSSDKERRCIERFDREILLCSKLQHPNIARLLDRGTCEGSAFAVFEFIEGHSLKQQLLESGQLNPVETADIMMQVLQGLIHAHEHGIVHRDLKPANIMLTKIGTKTHAKIIDFGIGSLFSELQNLDYKTITLTQETIGTPSYCAPEQLRGEPPTPQADIYVWGLVFIECLTGEPMASGASVASVFQKQLTPTNLPLPAAIANHTLAPILLKIIEKKPSQRMSKASDVYQVFKQLNFTTLVGRIKHSTTSKVHTYASKDNVCDQTLISTEMFFQTDLVERKQITVLCITLAAHSIFNNSFGAEEVNISERIEAHQQEQKKQCINIAQRYGAQYVGALGNTLLFYFGYPAVSDNDCRLCAKTALALTSHIEEQNNQLKKPEGIVSSFHIGIHSGLVTIHGQNIPEGETPNIAIALSHAAHSNQILCSQTTQRILESQIEFKPQTKVNLGLRKQYEKSYSMIGKRVFKHQLSLSEIRQPRAFVGRKPELRKLTKLLNDTTTGKENRRSMHIYGEAGIGKSRLLFEFQQRVSIITYLNSQCLPEQENQALQPIFDLLKNKYSLHTLATDVVITQLQMLLSLCPDIDAELATSILCSWLDLSTSDNISCCTLTPNESKKILFESLAYLLCLEHHSHTHGRYIFIIEDIQWADPISLEFLKMLTTSSHFSGSTHVFISTSRQTLPSLLKGFVKQVVELKKFNLAQIDTFSSQIFDGLVLTTSFRSFISERTDGVPLFIVKIMDMLKHKKLVFKTGNNICLRLQYSNYSVPDSLRETLQQQLDTLTFGKKIAQIAAVLGREFDYELLRQSTGQNEAQLAPMLDELIHAGLIYIKPDQNKKRFVFKHALVRETAYDSMPIALRIQTQKLVARPL
jgi:TOMM system kinase/cyclase fusion protein